MGQAIDEIFECVRNTSIARTIAKKLFYQLARLRLKYRFFAFPFEIPVLFRFNRYYNPECRI